MIGNLVSSARSSDCRSLVFARRIPAYSIGVRGSRGLLFNNSFQVARAVISSLNCSLCASLIISNSVSCNSLAVSSPFKRLSLGTLQFLIKRLTQLLTRTSDSPSSKRLTRCHLENLDGCKRQLFSLVAQTSSLMNPPGRSLHLVAA